MQTATLAMPLEHIVQSSHFFFEDAKKAYYANIQTHNYTKKTSAQNWEDFLMPYQCVHSQQDAYIKNTALILSGKARNSKGKRIWTWKDRLETLTALYASMPKLNPLQKKDLCRLQELAHTKYLQKYHSQELAHIHALLKPASLAQHLWEKVKTPLTYIALGATGLAIATSLSFFQPTTQQNVQAQPPQASYVSKTYLVKKGDTLWNIVKNKYSPLNNKQIYAFVDKVASINHRGKQSAYAIGSKNVQSPHYLLPGDTLFLPIDLNNPLP